MTILVQNITADEVKYVYRFNGARLHIAPLDFICFESFDTAEISYWSKQKNSNSLKSNGLRVELNLAVIKGMQKLKAHGKYVCKPVQTSKPVIEETPEMDVTLSIANTAEPIIISDQTEFSSEETYCSVTDCAEVENSVEIVENDSVENVENIVETIEPEITPSTYTYEYLNTLSKAEIKQILDGLNIPYKKNNSLSTLINLILTNQGED